MMLNRRPQLDNKKSQDDLNTIAASNSQRKSSHQKLSKALLSNHGLQDVFMICHSDGTTELANSSHVGHQLFKSLAELNKTKFVRSVKKDPERTLLSNRIALQLFNSVTDKGRGKIYTQLQLSGCDEWKEVSDQSEGRGLVFRALLSLFGIKDPQVKSKPEIVPSVPSSPPSSLKRAVDGMRSGSPNSLPPKKHVRFDAPSSPVPQEQHAAPKGPVSSKSFDAAKTLACMVGEDQEVPNPLSFLAGTFAQKVTQQSRSELNSKGFSLHLTSDGIMASQLRPNDMIVGCSGVGVMNLPTVGNRWFRSLVESETEAFSKFEKKVMLRMTHVTVNNVHDAGGRFLAIDPKSGLLLEVTKDTAWTKTLQTYKEFVSKHQQRDSIRKFNEAIQKQKSMERIQQLAFPSAHNRVQQMVDEEARARQG